MAVERLRQEKAKIKATHLRTLFADDLFLLPQHLLDHLAYSAGLEPFLKADFINIIWESNTPKGAIMIMSSMWKCQLNLRFDHFFLKTRNSIMHGLIAF